MLGGAGVSSSSRDGMLKYLYANQQGYNTALTMLMLYLCIETLSVMYDQVSHTRSAYHSFKCPNP